MFSPQLLIILGIALLAVAVIGFLIYLVIARRSKAKLEKQLDAEYGAKHD